ncbi:hypothetical protein STRUR_2251 [Streptococcus urinalis 2285-97]|uniref:ComR tetratricopeptide domain-containing protein n=1 Tax=Streptococcus urinalis 2285-97 TaxID=764291 RepID=G5KFI4_9STRE|nr:hypothetical protein STRUR_2251 [Streptococcus urinalis 2285-97]
MPIICIMEWKYFLNCLLDFKKAKSCHTKAILFANMMGDDYLEEKINEEWNKDLSKLNICYDD